MSLETKEYAKRLVEQMTLEEKISQMRYESPAIERLNIPVWRQCSHRQLPWQRLLMKNCLRRSEMWCPPRDGQSLKRIQEE